MDGGYVGGRGRLGKTGQEPAVVIPLQGLSCPRPGPFAGVRVQL